MSHLKKHRESVHEGVKYKCNECDHESTTKESLKVRRIDILLGTITQTIDNPNLFWNKLIEISYFIALGQVIISTGLGYFLGLGTDFVMKAQRP